MPIPVPIPSGTVPVTSAENDKVEAFVAYIAQVLKFGTSGFTVGGKNVADPATFPDGNNPTTLIAADESTEKSQAYFRQFAVAMLKSLSTAYISFNATCGAGDAVGAFVYVTGASKAVTKSDSTVAGHNPAVGVIVSKSDATHCVVQCGGIVYGVLSGLTPGQTYWISTAGTISLTPPGVGPAYVQSVGIAIDTDAFLIVPSAVVAI